MPPDASCARAAASHTTIICICLGCTKRCGHQTPKGPVQGGRRQLLECFSLPVRRYMPLRLLLWDRSNMWSCEKLENIGWLAS
mmetsp:Transcript_18331/g.30403  ORF Transcript_18331/g.30403 Transcript_18331/m.30403 type:complete len:83 (+) Transcript_18331:1710-1958(+)